MLIARHPTRWWDWFTPEDKKNPKKTQNNKTFFY